MRAAIAVAWLVAAAVVATLLLAGDVAPVAFGVVGAIVLAIGIWAVRWRRQAG